MSHFYIFDGWAMPTPYNHRFFVKKLAQGFTDQGCEVSFVRSIEDLRGPGYVMISNHTFLYSFGERCLKQTPVAVATRGINKVDPLHTLGKIGSLVQRSTLQRLLKHCAAEGLTVFAWFWDKHADMLMESGANIIFVGEKFWTEPTIPSHREWAQFCAQNENAHMIQFAAALHPNLVGVGCENQKYTVSFVGNRHYKPEWYGQFTEASACLRPTPPYISEEERLDIYRNSQVNLGFHAPDNILNGVVVERVFEALAYGCVCVTDNPHAAQATDGCALPVQSMEEMVETVERINQDADLRAALRNKGLAYAKAEGTYYREAGRMMALSQTLFGAPIPVAL